MVSRAPYPIPAERCSGVRHWVVVFAVTFAVISYIDRVCISNAAPAIREELHLSSKQMGWAFFAFGWAYALFEIPGGYLGDRMGPRRVLMRILMWWSLFTAPHGWGWVLTCLILTR